MQNAQANTVDKNEEKNQLTVAISGKSVSWIYIYGLDIQWEWWKLDERKNG